MRKLIVIALILTLFFEDSISAQDSEVITIAKQFCLSTNDFFYFETDQNLNEKVEISLSQIFDYKEAAYFLSTGTKTIMILPLGTLEGNLLKAAKHFEQAGKYTFAVRGQSRTMFIENKPIYRFYPYRDAIVFEVFDTK